MATSTSESVTQEAAELWVKSFQGEVFGEAYFDAMAAHSGDAELGDKLTALAALERCTKELLIPSMERLGISTEPDAAIVKSVGAMTDFDYQSMVQALPMITGEYLGYYARLRELVEPEDCSVVNLLIAHELALELFARREMAGDTATSLQPIRALPHVTI
jgi:hypothetical protein